VPWVKLVCGKVGGDVDGTTVQPGRPALRLLSVPAACMGRQLVPFHGAGNRSPRVVVEVLCLKLAPHVMAHISARVGGSSCEAETCRARRRLIGGGRGIPLVGNWLETLPIGWKHDVLPVWVLTGVLNPPRLESWP
jgi:hypothetical protein